MYLICSITDPALAGNGDIEVLKMYRYFQTSFGICLQYLLSYWQEFSVMPDDIFYENLAYNVIEGNAVFGCIEEADDYAEDFHQNFDVLYQVLLALISELRPHIEDLYGIYPQARYGTLIVMNHTSHTLEIHIDAEAKPKCRYPQQLMPQN
jgi:hypothetical protein